MDELPEPLVRFIHSANICEPDIFLNAGDKVMNKTDKLPALMLFPVLGEKKVNKKQVIR